MVTFKWLALFMVVLLVSLTSGQGFSDRKRQWNEKPNIVIVMTDDQDVLLGSMNYMPKTLRILKEGGAHFTNAFTNSPICCPSRSSFLTGLHVHNHNVWTNNANCSSLYWRENFEVRSFATFLQNAGYRTGYFGKYLNDYVGEHVPDGWREWMGLVKNSAFYNYTVNFNGHLIRHGFDYEKDYFTDLIANDSLTFFKQSKLYHPNKPVAMVLSMPAPHGPEDSAPQYADMFQNVTDHRTPSWNYAPNPDKDYLLQITGKMEPIQAHFTDMLMRKRVMTLQSVDDAVEKVYDELKALGELDNTYIIYVSDHGYHLGQFGIPKGKSMPFDFDTRIPLFIRGPNIKPGSIINNLVGIIDITPTLLDIAEVDIPDDIDGKSLKPLLDDSASSGIVQKKAWRDTFLIERGKVRKQLIDDILEDEDLSENFLPIYFTRSGNIEDKCNKPKYQYPCKPRQKFYCHSDTLGRKRIRKCNKLTKPCSCKARQRYRRRHRSKRESEKDDGSFVQKCSIVDGAVQCVKLDQPQRDWEQQRLALNSLIDEYREQLSLLKDLRKNIRDHKGEVDITKYKLTDEEGNTTPASFLLTNSSTSSSTSVAPPATTSLSVTFRTDALTAEKAKEGRCFCLDENDISEHQAQPDDIMDEEAELELSEDDQDEDVDELDNEEEEINPNLQGLSRREQKRLERKLKREQRRKEKQLKRRNVECDPYDRRCLRKQKKKQLQFTKRNNPHCQVEGAECSIMDNTHWKTEPRWTLGAFCFCNNAQSNVFWCLRTMNDTHNFLYCEYINGYLSYFDMNRDPYQLRNAIHDLPYSQLGQLHELLLKLRKCKGGKECTYRHREKLNLDIMSGGRSMALSPSVKHIRS